MSGPVIFKVRILTIISLLIIIPAGFYSKFYSGPYYQWVNNSLGGSFYEIFWGLLAFLLFPGIKIWKIVLTVFVVTCLLEFSQLWNNRLLNYFRSFFIGRTIIGNSFNTSDFIYYVAGSIAAYFWIVLIKNREIVKDI